jgi:hypothetical protein
MKMKIVRDSIRKGREIFFIFRYYIIYLFFWLIAYFLFCASNEKFLLSKAKKVTSKDCERSYIEKAVEFFPQYNISPLE